MGCSGDREKGIAPLEEQWDYVNLDDFKSDSCWSPFSYIFLWIMLLVSTAVYGVDIFTAVNLLAFHRWSGSVEPAIPFKISRWIFAVCIIVSIVLLGYRWLLAIRAMRSGSIVRSYLDPLAVRIQSFRVLEKNGRGWKRFLVFADLTKSKKGAEYVALYTYFAFQFWMNTIFADGPRQVINAITLYSVMKADLLPGGENAKSDSSSSGASQFFSNLKILAEDSTLQAVVLFGMLFTLIIWVLSVLKLISAVILYLIFLFHHIPEEDGSLKAYCRRKASTRLKQIVRHKVDKALAKGLQLQDRHAVRPGLATMDSKPTLPSVDMDKNPVVSTLSRTTTQTTLPPYTRTNSNRTDQNPTLPNLEFDSKPPLSRTTTQASAISADSAPLTAHAAPMGYSPLDRQKPPLPPVPPLPSNVPSRMGSAPPRQTPGSPPFANQYERNSPAGGYRNLTDSAAQPHRTFTPAADPYSTPYGDSGAGVRQGDYFNQAHTPARYDPYASGESPYAEEEDYDIYGAPMDERDHLAQSNYPSQDEYAARSYTPASAGPRTRPQDPYQARSFTPASANGSRTDNGYRTYTPSNAAANTYSQNARSYTPASTGATPAPQGAYRSYTPATSTATPAPQDTYRSYTPASVAPTHNSQESTSSMRFMPTSRTPAPQAEAQPVQPPARAYTPMGPETPAAQSSGYTAFNPMATTQTPEPSLPRIQPPTGYQPFSRAQTVSPSTMNRDAPAGYSFNRSHTDRI